MDEVYVDYSTHRYDVRVIESIHRFTLEKYKSTEKVMFSGGFFLSSTPKVKPNNHGRSRHSTGMLREYLEETSLMLTEHPVLRVVRCVATVLSLMLLALLVLTVLSG